MQASELRAQFNRPPAAALAFFRQKGMLVSQRWTDVWQAAHAKAFTVAGVLKLDVLQDIRDALDSAMANGEPFASFQQRLIPVLQAKGWWGKAIDTDTGEITQTIGDKGLPATLGTPRRLKTIFQTNLQSAYMAGRHQGMLASADTHPYWQYVAVLDFRTRDSHAAMHGKVFRYDDPIWDTHYPPNGYNCRCRVRPLSQHSLNEEKLALSSSVGQLREAFVPVSRRDPTQGYQPVTVFQSPEMPNGFAPDPGFNFNPAKAAFQPELDRYDYRVARQYVQGVLTGPAFAGWYKELGGGLAELRAANPGLDSAALRTLAAEQVAVGQLYPVAVLDDVSRELLGATTRVVRVSDETMLKQLIHRDGQDLGLADYAMLQETIEQAQLIVRDSESTLVFIRRGGRLYHAAIKKTRSGKALFLTSFRLASDKTAAQAAKRGEVLRNVLWEE